MSSPPSSAEPPGVDVWVAHDARLSDPALLGAFDRVLSADERDRIARMVLDSRRQQQRVTRAMVRLVLSNYLPEVAPADWRFAAGEHGRPGLAGDLPDAARALDFNVAHTAGVVVMAVGRQLRLGIDVERADGRARLAIARRYFSPAEAAALESLPPAEQPRRFTRLWTLKEAYLKAIGTGVAGGLGSTTFHLEDGGVRFERAADAEAERWRFAEFDIEGGYRVALACLPSGSGEIGSPRLRDFPVSGMAAGGSGQEQGAESQ